MCTLLQTADRLVGNRVDIARAECTVVAVSVVRMCGPSRDDDGWRDGAH